MKKLRLTMAVLLFAVSLPGVYLAPELQRAGPSLPGLRNGDLLFRKGTGFVSNIVLTADPAGEFSHVGIVLETPSGPHVIHVEPQDETGNQGVAVAEPVSAFLAPRHASAFAVFRPTDPAAGALAVQQAQTFVEAAIPFDTAFDLHSSDRFYCTELVSRAYAAAGLDLSPASALELYRLAGFSQRVLVPSGIVRNDHFRNVTNEFLKDIQHDPSQHASLLPR